MPSTQRQHQTTRSQAHQPSLFGGDRKSPIPTPTPTASATSAKHAHGLPSSPQHENAYLCAWLRSRLEDGLWLIRQESALTATESDRRQVTTLANTARQRGLPVWPPRKVVAA